jgi:hypothetical protein
MGREIAATADAAGIRVFIKDNAHYPGIRRQKPPFASRFLDQKPCHKNGAGIV